MKIVSKSLLSAAGAAAALVSTAAPAEAQYRHRDRDGISAGEVIAGAVILGGLAAVLSASKTGRYQDGNDDRDYNNGYSYSTNSGSSRAAVNQCINQVENQSDGYSRSNVTQIRSIERTRYGYRVLGTLEGQNSSRSYDRYGQGNRYDQNDRYYQGNRYDQNDRYGRSGYSNRGADAGQFTCYVERGRVVDIDYNGSNRWN